MSVIRKALVGLAFVSLSAGHVLGAQQVAMPLRLGDRFPEVAGRSLADRDIVFPAAGATKPTVVVASFSREGGTDARCWSERLDATSASSDVNVLILAELESVPRLLRGAVSYTIKRGVPPSLRDHMLILVRDEATWRQQLAVTSSARSYAVLVDTAGAVRWMSTGPCNDDQLAQARGAIAASRTPFD